MNAYQLLLVLLGLCVIGGWSAVPPCSCNYGNVDIETPQCVCSCFGDYLMPHCLYTATDDVPMNIWLTTPPNEFSKEVLLQSLEWGLDIDTPSELTFSHAMRSIQYNKTGAWVVMKGDKAQQLLVDYYNNHSWLQEASIESAWEAILSLPSGGSKEVDNSYVLYYSTDSNVVVTLSGIAWLLAALVTALLVSMIDNLFFKNNEVEVYNAIAFERENQQRHHVRQRNQNQPEKSVSPFGYKPNENYETRQVHSTARNPLNK